MSGNPQIRRTKKLLSDALIQLMKQKPFEKISIREIVKQADLSRSAFYTHYSSKEAILYEKVQEIGDEAAESDCGPEGSWDEAPMTPSRAAIVLADDHSAKEERQCLAVLESVGLSWQQVQDTAARVGVFLQEVEDGEVGS